MWGILTGRTVFLRALAARNRNISSAAAKTIRSIFGIYRREKLPKYLKVIEVCEVESVSDFSIFNLCIDVVLALAVGII